MLNVTIQNDGKIKIQSEGYIDSYCDGKKPILLTGYEDEVTKAAKKFDSSECLKVCIQKH